MRPALKSGLLPVWRDRNTLQIGIDPRRAVALSGMSQAAVLIGLLDGSRDRDQLIAAAAGHGVPASTTERILTLLAAGGAIDDFPAGTLRELPPPMRAKLAAELATASLAHGDCDGGAQCLARRRAAQIRIEGELRIGRAVARILRSSGVGRVDVARLDVGRMDADRMDADRMDAGQLEAGAARGTDAGRPPASRSGSASSRSRPAAATRPDLAILVGRQPPDRTAQLVSDRIPHLAVSAYEAIGVVGPLVIPGQTACLRCLDYFRAGNDPAWPLILAQLSDRRPDPAACDAALAWAVAAQAAAQALTAIDRAPAVCAAANGTLELVLPGWQWHRRTWRPHPACPCALNAVSSTPRNSRQ